MKSDWYNIHYLMFLLCFGTNRFTHFFQGYFTGNGVIYDCLNVSEGYVKHNTLIWPKQNKAQQNQVHIEGLVQKRCNSSALAMELCLSCTNLTPPRVAESDQRHAQHPLKMLGIDFSCGLYQTNSERIMLLNSWYQIDISLYSNRYLFVRSKIGGQKWQPHILC